jgi:hypothetical protein
MQNFKEEIPKVQKVFAKMFTIQLHSLVADAK